MTSLKGYLIVTHFDNFKHNFPKESETFQIEKLEDAIVFVRNAISYPRLINNKFKRFLHCDQKMTNFFVV